MRCYFLRDNRIEAVELLRPGPDLDLIQQAAKLSHRYPGMHHFEVWENRRLVFRSEPSKSVPAARIREE
jgi:hypothetical protein